MLARCFAGLRLFPEVFFQALGRARKAARDEIERLIVRPDSTIDVGGFSGRQRAPATGRETPIRRLDRLLPRTCWPSREGQSGAWLDPGLRGDPA